MREATTANIVSDEYVAGFMLLDRCDIIRLSHADAVHPNCYVIISQGVKR